MAEDLRRRYDPGDGTVGECSATLLAEALGEARGALQGPPADGPDPEARGAVLAFVAALERVAVGLRGDLRTLAEHAEDIEAPGWIPGETLAEEIGRCAGAGPKGNDR